MVLFRLSGVCEPMRRGLEPPFWVMRIMRCDEMEIDFGMTSWEFGGEEDL